MNNQLNILLIDDDLEFSELVMKALKIQKNEKTLNVVAAEDPYEAINLMIENPFDLIVLDWNLQGINGSQTLQKASDLINVDPTAPMQWHERKTPVVVFSAEEKENLHFSGSKYFKISNHIVKGGRLDQIANQLKKAIFAAA